MGHESQRRSALAHRQQLHPGWQLLQERLIPLRQAPHSSDKGLIKQLFPERQLRRLIPPQAQQVLLSVVARIGKRHRLKAGSLRLGGDEKNMRWAYSVA